MDWYVISIIIFILILALIVYKDRKNWTRDSILLIRKTSRTRNFLIRIGTGLPRFWLVVGGIAVVIGFFMSVYIFYMLIDILMKGIFIEPVPGLALVLPSPTSELVIAPGVIGIPFWYWIISIALLVIVHEGSHGIFAARERVRIKSLGVGILAVIPLAFVEPDEKQLAKKKTWQQLRVFAAGSFANFVLAGVSVLIVSMMSISIFVPAGIAYQGLITDYPAAGVNLTGVIVGINSYTIKNNNDLSRALTEIGPNKGITIYTKVINGSETINKTFKFTTTEEPEPEFKPDAYTNTIAGLEQAIPGTIEFSQSVSSLFGGGEKTWRSVQLEIKYWEYINENYPSLTNKANSKITILEGDLDKYPRKGFIGIYFNPAVNPVFMEIKPEFKSYSDFINFLSGLLFFLFLINLGVGAFNLLPLGPLDGGRMWKVVLDRYIPKHSKNIFKVLSYITLLVILFNFALVFSVAF